MKNPFGDTLIENDTSPFGDRPEASGMNPFGDLPVDVEEAAEATPQQQPPAPVDQPRPDPGFVKNAASAFKDRTKELGGYVGRQDNALKEAPVIVALAAGETMGFLGDVVAEGAKRAYKSLVPEPAQETVKEAFSTFAGTKVGQYGLQALQKGGEEWAKFEKGNPDGALVIKSMLNLFGGSLVTPKNLGKNISSVASKTAMTAKEAKDIAVDVSKMTRGAISPEAAVNTAKIVEDGYRKGVGVKPKFSKSSPQYKAHIYSINSAVRSIVDNVDDLAITDGLGNTVKGLPKNLRQFSEAVSSTKAKLFQRYDAIARQAGAKGAGVELDGIISDLNRIVSDQSYTPDIKRAAQKSIEELREIGRFSATEAQNRIKILNSRLGSPFDYKSSGNRLVDGLVVTKLRQGLNDAIDSLDDAGVYSGLKKEYGALREIEESVAKKAAQVANKSSKGLLDYTDVFTTGTMTYGLATGNPALFAKGAVERGLKSYYKYLNDPNKAIEKMFKKVDQVQTNGGYKPKSNLMKKVQKSRQPTISDTAMDKYDIPTYLRQDKDLTEFLKDVETDVYRYLPEVSYAKSSIPRIETIIREGSPPVDIKTKNQLRKEADVEGIQKAVDMAFKKQRDAQGKKGPPLLMPRNEFTKSSIPKIETTLQPSEVKQIIKTRMEVLKEKEVEEIIRRKEQLFAGQKRRTIGAPLSMPKNEFVKSPRKMTVEERLKNIKE